MIGALSEDVSKARHSALDAESPEKKSIAFQWIVGLHYATSAMTETFDTFSAVFLPEAIGQRPAVRCKKTRILMDFKNNYPIFATHFSI
jgi:hypothetical protein